MGGFKHIAVLTLLFTLAACSQVVEQAVPVMQPQPPEAATALPAPAANQAAITTGQGNTTSAGSTAQNTTQNTSQQAAAPSASSQNTTFHPPAASQPEGPSCTDSDGGKEFNIKGTTTLKLGESVISYTDDCIENVLREWSCEGIELVKTYKTCSCSDGACH
jgi:hypothetical protein